MKKLLLSLAAATIAFAANATTLYCVGSGTVNGKSLPGSPDGNCVAVESNDNVVTFTASNIGWLKISDTNATDWATFNKNGFTIEGKGDYALKASELGQPFKLWYSDGKSEGTNNINPPSNGEYTYKLTVGEKGTSNSTLVVTGKSDTPIIYDIYLRGSFDSNWAALPEYKFTPDANGVVYTLNNVTLPKGTKFKIADANWGSINFGLNQSVNANTEYTLVYNADDIVLNQDINNATVTFNINTEVMYINDPTADPDVPIDPGYGNYWVHVGGEFNGNDFYNDGVQPDNGIASFSDLAIGNGTFKIHVWNGKEDLYYIMDSADGNTQVPTGEWVQFVIDGYDIYDYVKGATSTSKYDVKYNVETNQIYITLVEGGDVPVDPTPGELPETLYLIGNVNGYAWSSSKGVAATNEDGMYTYTGVTVNAGATGSGYFSFATVLGEGWDGEGNVNSGNRYGATTKDEEIEAGEESMVQLFAANVNASGCYSWMLAPGKYDMVVNLKEMTLLVTVSEGGDVPVDPTPGELPEKLYLIGNVNDYNWDEPIKGVETIGNDGVYIWEEVVINNASSGKGYFAFSTLIDGDWDYINSGDRYGAPAENTPLEIGQTSEVTLYAANVNASGSQSWSVNAGIYTIIVNLKDMQITLADATTDGVESVGVENGEAVYFNLQGQKVVNPEHGIYIRVLNGKAVKVVK